MIKIARNLAQEAHTPFASNVKVRLVVSIFFRLIDHQLNWNLENRFFPIFGIFDHV